jgi:hypothetical protein
VLVLGRDLDGLLVISGDWSLIAFTEVYHRGLGSC